MSLSAKASTVTAAGVSGAGREVDRLLALVQRFTGGQEDAVILIVEDEPEARATLRQAIEGIGLTVAEAVNGRVALNWLGGNARPALVVLNVTMPKADGFEFLAQMRRSPRLADVPVAMLTAKPSTDNEPIVLAEHTLLVLSKSASPAPQLLGRIKALLGGGGA